SLSHFGRSAPTCGPFLFGRSGTRRPSLRPSRTRGSRPQLAPRTDARTPSGRQTTRTPWRARGAGAACAIDRVKRIAGQSPNDDDVVALSFFDVDGVNLVAEEAVFHFDLVLARPQVQARAVSADDGVVEEDRAAGEGGDAVERRLSGGGRAR